MKCFDASEIYTKTVNYSLAFILNIVQSVVPALGSAHLMEPKVKECSSNNQRDTNKNVYCVCVFLENTENFHPITPLKILEMKLSEREACDTDYL